MSRLIIDTYSHGTVMESARPTGRQANTQHSDNLKQALAKADSEKSIKSAIRTFYAERGLNLVCRMLDYFFTGGERVYARNLLIAMEILHVMSELDCKDDNVVASKATTIKKALYDYLKEIELLPAGSTVIEEELEYDTLTATPKQSPFLMGRLLSKLCQLSSFSSEMVKTWQVSAFNVYGDEAKTSELHQSSTKKIITHLPVCGTVSLQDKGLGFDNHPFEFRSKNIDGNSFCREFLCAAGLGNTLQSGSDSLTRIHNTAKELRKVQNEYAQIKQDFDTKQQALYSLEFEIKRENREYEFNAEEEVREILPRYQQLNTPLQELYRVNEALVEKFKILQDKHNLFELYNAKINNKTIDGKMTTTIDLGVSEGKRLIKLVYFSDNVNTGNESLPPLPEQVPEEIDINRIKYHYEGLINVANSLEVKQNEYKKNVAKYETEVNNYCTQCGTGFDSKLGIMNSLDTTMNEQLHTRVSVGERRTAINNPGNNNINMLRDNTIKSIQSCINQRIAIQNFANEIQPVEMGLIEQGRVLSKAQKDLKLERVNFLNLSDQIPEDALGDIMTTLADKQNYVGRIFAAVDAPQLISRDDLIKLSESASNDRLARVTELARQYYDNNITQENSAIESAMHEQMPVTPAPRSSVQASPLASPGSSVQASPLASPRASVQASPLSSPQTSPQSSPLSSPMSTAASTSSASSSQPSLTFRRHPN